ncbi:esterase E4-like [Plodia interpunctella]|uniref:esterase E4-like n=1 Tax=Plodia interpunctella TaxID=58824 RepID=UPI002367CE75|nr:esterase E4-like [Plodia interpunctella]XP_053601341.1 esterase E4-like [Plodia interpunctella]
MDCQCLLVCVIILYAAYVEGESGSRGGSRLVQTAQGPVRGRKDPLTGVFAFYDIPYAKAPIGSEKFKAPLPPPTWHEPLDAVNRGIVCPQVAVPIDMGEIHQQEDCLVASVFTPDIDKTDLPVVVVVHGGGFQIGFGNMLLPRYYVKSHDLIVVTFNYRLGIHGFLCLGTEMAPGNAGLRDQLAVLKWVQKNIRSFGGDPDNVTISGASAGSMFVDLLQLLPAFQGLFHKIIPESGSSLSGTTVMIDPIETAKTFAQDLNFNKVDDVYALEEFYTTATFEQLLSRSFMNRTDQNFGFTPCLDRDVGNGVIVPDSPLNIMKSGKYNKLPVLVGFANMEGILYMSTFEIFRDMMNKKFSDFVPYDLQFENLDEKEKVAQHIKEFYFGEKPVDYDTMYQYIDFFSDVTFVSPTARSMKLQLAAGNKDIYLYEYSFVDTGGTPLYLKNYTTTAGATHCAQTFAIFDGKFINSPEEDDLSPEFKRMKKVMRQMWFNFSSSGNPVPEGSSLPRWPAMGADLSPHMSLGRSLELRGPLLPRRMRFWEDIYARHHRSPVPPSAPPPRRTEL